MALHLLSELVPSHSIFAMEEKKLVKPDRASAQADAFIGTRAFVMPGVRVGARSLVGACSVVTKDVPDDCVAAGNPRRVLRPR